MEVDIFQPLRVKCLVDTLSEFNLYQLWMHIIFLLIFNSFFFFWVETCGKYCGTWEPTAPRLSWEVNKFITVILPLLYLFLHFYSQFHRLPYLVFWMILFILSEKPLETILENDLWFIHGYKWYKQLCVFLFTNSVAATTPASATSAEAGKQTKIKKVPWRNRLFGHPEVCLTEGVRASY